MNRMIKYFICIVFLICISGCTSKDDLNTAINMFIDPCCYISLFPLVSTGDSNVVIAEMYNASILYLLDDYGIKNRKEYLYEHLRNGIPIPLANKDYVRCATVQMDADVINLYEEKGIKGILEKYVRNVGGDYLLWKYKSCEYLYPDSVFENVAEKSQLESIQYLLYCHNIYTYTFWYDEDPCMIIGIAAFSREEVQKHINF